ncbi:CSMD3-like protein [Mya arenaria]|uniref:CSMD3-like protein n=1 Tax=Mya arenaria TaxID=6604 RepID=A0ABY7DLN2_MYAAR|nr:CSMD3-like protein [Mya arenaria]
MGNFYFVGDGACMWPTEFRDSQFYDSSRGALTFFTTTMEGWAFEPTAGSGDVYSRTNQTFPLFSQQYYAYLCITITSVTSASYMYYINHRIETNLNHERLFIYPVNSLTDQGTICSTNLGSSGGEYQMLVRIGTEQQAKVDCPWPLLGRYGYTYTTSSGDTSCDLTTSDLGVCSDTQQFTFDYTACSTRVSYSQSDTVWCVNTVSDGDTNYVMLFNGNDNDALIDNAISDDSSAASVAPMYCRPNQIPTDFAQTASGNNLGSKLEFGAAKATCPAVEGPERGNVTVTTTGAVTSAVYLCQDNYTLWGDDTRVCQADDTWSGSKPSCNCASPPVPANGAVTVSTDGSTATYTCQLGYTLSGLATRACIDGNAWEDADPGCVKCDTLQIVTGQTSVMSTNNTMTSVSFTCAKGYTLNGTLQLTCSSSGQWNGLQPQCVICDVLTNPASGTLTSTSDGSVTTATYACSSGYTLEGDDTRTCQLDGSWTGVMPSCTCNAPSAPASGTVRSNGTVATYTCTQGYTINGPSTRNCQTDGSGWSGANPTCTLCQTLTTVTGGSYTMVTSGTVTSATYTCNVGYSLDGASSIACESSGSWNNVQPKCVQCPTLTDPSSGTVALTSSGSKTSATYACASGYNLNGNTIRLCNSDACQAPLTPANGDMTHDGSTASYSCHLGYSLAGLSSRTCGTDSSGWSGSNPSCSVCATLNYPTGGSVSMSTDGINTQADYTCNSGYTLNGAATIACRSDGTWNFAAPMCAKCPDLSDPRSGTVTVSTTGGVTTATYACQTGYYISGNYLLTCQTTGSWDNTSPTCKCNFPSTPSNGAVSVSDSTGGTTATYSCLVGYSLSGLASRLCMADGSGWQGADPICVVCQTISTPTAGTYSLSTSSTNTKVTFTCNVGTTLEGNSELVCQSDGTWNNAPPTCVTCDTLIDPNSGSVTLSSSGLATTATFSCVTGYTLTSTATLTCGGDGTWDLPSPNCVCSSPPLVTNGGFNVTADFAIVSYTCNVNYVLVGSETRTCQSDGTGWSGLAPTCGKKHQYTLLFKPCCLTPSPPDVDPAFGQSQEDPGNNITLYIAIIVVVLVILISVTIVMAVFIHLYFRLRQGTTRVASASGRRPGSSTSVALKAIEDANRPPLDIDTLPPPRSSDSRMSYSARLRRPVSSTRPDSSASAADIFLANGNSVFDRTGDNVPLTAVRLPSLASKPPTGHEVNSKRITKRKKIGELKTSKPKHQRPKTPIEKLKELGRDRVLTPELLQSENFNYILPQYVYDIETPPDKDMVVKRKGKRRKSGKRHKPETTETRKEHEINIGFEMTGHGNTVQNDQWVA